MINSKELAFIILIGGKSTRFGSDKGIYEFKGKSLISHQLETLSQFNHDIFIVAHSKKQIKEYIEKIDYKTVMAFIIDDSEIIHDKNVRSPLIGIYSALKELEVLNYNKAFILSCDLPMIEFKVVDLIITQSGGYDCCIPKWDNNFLEPLFAIYPIKETLIRAEANLKNGTFKLTNLIDSS